MEAEPPRTTPVSSATPSPASPRQEGSPRQESIGAIRRTTRPKACAQCRHRKQRCEGTSVPCERCARAGKECSFIIEGVTPFERQQETLLRSEEIRKVPVYTTVLRRLQVELDTVKQEMVATKRRITALEVRKSLPESCDAQPMALDPTVLSRGTNMSHPALPFFSDVHMFSTDLLVGVYPNATSSIDLYEFIGQSSDPVVHGVISMEEAQTMFDKFFSYCHGFAPCISIKNQSDASLVREQSPFLFSAICLVGSRCWHADDVTTQTWMHPRYSSLVAIYDNHLRNLQQRPTAADFTLESVQALLLAIQWPPLDIGIESEAVPKSRYNSSYAWLMIGTAIRFAKYIGLDSCSEVNFSDPSIGEPQLAKLRVWLNLVACDRHLTLTAGLPASLEAPSINVLRAFAGNRHIQEGDMQLAGLGELLAVVQRASLSSGDVTLRTLDAISLRVAVADLNEWEKRWALILGAEGSFNFRQHLPFTSLTWYRLALNAIPIGGALGALRSNSTTPASHPTPLALADGLEAALNLISQYSTKEAAMSGPQSVGGSALTMTPSAVKAFIYAPDTHFVTYTFAVVFLVLLFDRGCISPNLNPLPNIEGQPREPVSQNSPLYRAVQLASSVFADAAQKTPRHPAVRYKDMVAKALFVLSESGVPVEDAAGTAIADMLESLLASDQEWTFLKALGYRG